MELMKEMTFSKDKQFIETYLFDETKLDEDGKPTLVEDKKFKSLLSYGRYEDKLKEKYEDKLIVFPTVVTERNKK
jgi:hypothetical protein